MEENQKRQKDGSQRQMVKKKKSFQEQYYTVTLLNVYRLFSTPVTLPLFPPLYLHPFSPHYIMLQFHDTSAQKPRKETGMQPLKTKLTCHCCDLEGK